MPPGATETANQRVSETIQPFSGSMSSTRGPYTKLIPAQTLTIGKRAAEYGTTRPQGIMLQILLIMLFRISLKNPSLCL